MENQERLEIIKISILSYYSGVRANMLHYGEIEESEAVGRFMEAVSQSNNPDKLLDVWINLPI